MWAWMGCLLFVNVCHAGTSWRPVQEVAGVWPKVSCATPDPHSDIGPAKGWIDVFTEIWDSDRQIDRRTHLYAPLEKCGKLYKELHRNRRGHMCVYVHQGAITKEFALSPRMSLHTQLQRNHGPPLLQTKSWKPEQLGYPSHSPFFSTGVGSKVTMEAVCVSPCKCALWHCPPPF